MSNNEKISFARQVKEELASVHYDKEEMKYILSGYARNGGVFSLGKNPSFTIQSEIAVVARLIYSCFKTVYSLNPTIDFSTVNRFGKKRVYIVKVEDKRLYDIMADLEVLEDGIFRLPLKEGLHKKNFRYVLIGSFLTRGSINNPLSNKTSYFLEIAFSDKNDALAIKRKLDTFKEEKTMEFKYIQRRDKHVLYLKKSDQISVCLSYLGAVESMFSFEDARITKEDRNISNRFIICDTVNLHKTLVTANRDIQAINTLLNYYKLENFDEKTKAVITVRKEHEDLNYRELADYVVENYGIQITKSGVVHILTNLRKKADEIKPDKEDNNK